MRPKLLEIEGLQSFQTNQSIDFENLGETGLFGIFGPTGSGKSTVLDAITLALYGRVKRADRGTQGIINANMDSARVSFTFELLLGNHRKTYRVERRFQRKKGTENSCEPKVVRLIELTASGELPLCDKTTDVTNRIEALLGLNHDDFTRAVVLPQNSFQEFLFLDNAKKREMLERIFYLEEYGKQLLDKLSRKIAGMKSRLDVLSGELLGYADATDEALALTQMEMEAAAVERIRAEKEFRLVENKYTEAREVWQLVQDLSLVTQREELHAATRDEINENRLLLDAAVKADSLLERIRKTEELEGMLTGTLKQLEEVLRNLPTIEEDFQQTKLQNDAMKKEATLEQPRLVGLKARLTDALAIQLEIDTAGQKLQELQKSSRRLSEEQSVKSGEYTREIASFEELTQAIVRLYQQIAQLQVTPEYREQIQLGVQLENEVEVRRSNCIEINKKIAVLSAVMSALDKNLKQMQDTLEERHKAINTLTVDKQKHEASMPENRNRIDGFKDEMLSVKNALEILNIRKTELDMAEKKVASLEAYHRDLAEKAKVLQALTEKNRGLFEQNKLEVAAYVRDLEKNSAYMLSQTLRQGDPCPVCGSIEHPSPAAHADNSSVAELEKNVANAKEKLAASEKAFREAENNLLVANEQVNSCVLQREQALHERDAKRGQVLVEKEKMAEPYRELDLIQLQQELDRMSGVYAEKLKALESWDKKRDDYQAAFQKLNDDISNERLQEGRLSAELGVNRENLNQLNEALTAATTEMEGKKGEYSLFLQSMNIENAAKEMKKMAANDKKAELLQKQMEQNQVLSEKKRTAAEQLKEAIQGLKNAAVKVQAETDSLTVLRLEKESKVKEIAGTVGIEVQLKQTELKLAEYDRLDKLYRDKLQGAEKQLNSLLSTKSTLENQRGIYSDSLEQENKLLSAALIEKGFQTQEEAKLAYIPPDRLKMMKEQISIFDQKAINIQAEKDIVQKKLKSRAITEEQWIALDGQYQEMTAFKEACATQSELTKSSFVRIQSKHDRWVELNKSFTALSRQFELYMQIQKLLKAERSKDNSFIDYIAEERLRYVAAKASDILGVMTKYKYALELDANAGFIVRDNANGGAHRMVTSLSGGETFLTALSLALALSEQIQLKGQSPLEFFFLDEGFGTLDNSLLDSVLDSLERLSRKERVIGIISHVPELRNRIARRLIVTPPAPQGEGSRVKIERA